MPATQAKAGFGTLFQIGDGATPTEAFTTVGEVRSVTPPPRTLDVDDATNMESPNGYEEVIATILRTGEAQVELNFLEADTSQAQLVTDMEAKTLRNFRIVLPGGAKRFVFSAYVTGFEPTVPHDGRMTANCRFRTSGRPVLEDVA